MRIILATAHPYIPQIAGGAQSNMHEMAIALGERGHQVTVVAGLMSGGLLGLSARVALKLGRPFHLDDKLGYPVVRSWFPWTVAGPIVQHVIPDVVIAQSGFPARIADAFRHQGVPTIIHLHNVEEDDLAGITAGSGDAFIANSQFTAARASADFGISARVIVPSFIREKYFTARRGKFVTMVNPHHKKGVDMMLEIVRLMPAQPFLFVKAWTLSKAEEENLVRASEVLPNLTIRDRTTDMRSVYADTKVLAMPSVWEEAWGRVATEAQFSGIPVVGANRGGIAEAIGDGGIVLPVGADANRWVKALSTLLKDPEQYALTSQAALDHSRRDAINLDQQMAALEQVCEQVIGPLSIPDSSGG